MHYYYYILLVDNWLWQISSAESGQVIGKVYKQWAGFVREMATDADNFGIKCEYARSFTVAFKTCRILDDETIMFSSS